MNNWRSYLIFGMLLAASLPLTTPCAQPGDEDWFPVLAWGGNQDYQPAGKPLTIQTFRDMKAAGITIAGFALDLDELDLIHEAGLVAYYSDPRIKHHDWLNSDTATFPALAAAAVRETSAHPALYGYFIADEPGIPRFAAQSQMYQIVRELAPGKDLYLNLFPNYAGAGPLGTESYREYLDTFIQTFHPYWLSYDFYGIMEHKRDTLRDGYWTNLEEVRAATLEAGIPFILCTLGVAHFNYRQPTTDDLFFEVFSGLIYGAKGINLFTYFTPDVGNYRSAAINSHGEKTQVWYSLQEVFGSVHTIAGILNRLQSTAVYHLPLHATEQGTRGSDENSVIRQIGGAEAGPGFVVGEFRHTKTNDLYVMILNKDLERSHAINQIDWQRQPETIQVVSQSRPGVLRTFTDEEVWLAPGHAVLLKVTLP